MFGTVARLVATILLHVARCTDTLCYPLLQLNGRLGQFRAVASVLVDMDTSSAQHNNLVVLSIWEAITNNKKLRKANAFSVFLSHLHQCRQNVLLDRDPAHPAPPQHLGSSLLPSDRWLVSQLGVALLKLCERNGEWQNGYVILHHLHRFGIHYVRLSQPPSALPPLLPTPPSPCSVALTAVNLCLHLHRETQSALEVMRGCGWVLPSEGEGKDAEKEGEGEEEGKACERDQRTEVLTSLAQQCLGSKMLEDTWQCVEAVESCKISSRFLQSVASVHNKLLLGVLDSRNHHFAVTVFEGMCKAALQCLPSVFSRFLQLLCDKEQVCA